MSAPAEQTTSAFDTSATPSSGSAALDDFDFGGAASGMASTEISDLFGNERTTTTTSYQDDDDFALDFSFNDDDDDDDDLGEFDDFDFDDLPEDSTSDNPYLRYIPTELMPKSGGAGTLVTVLILFVLNLAALGGVILGVMG